MKQSPGGAADASAENEAQPGDWRRWLAESTRLQGTLTVRHIEAIFARDMNREEYRAHDALMKELQQFADRVIRLVEFRNSFQEVRGRQKHHVLQVAVANGITPQAVYKNLADLGLTAEDFLLSDESYDEHMRRLILRSKNLRKTVETILRFSEMTPAEG
jgi:hypothetical protein